jgi:hypothetical protein
MSETIKIESMRDLEKLCERLNIELKTREIQSSCTERIVSYPEPNKIEIEYAYLQGEKNSIACVLRHLEKENLIRILRMKYEVTCDREQCSCFTHDSETFEFAEISLQNQ